MAVMHRLRQMAIKIWSHTHTKGICPGCGAPSQWHTPLYLRVTICIRRGTILASFCRKVVSSRFHFCLTTVTNSRRMFRVSHYVSTVQGIHNSHEQTLWARTLCCFFEGGHPGIYIYTTSHRLIINKRQEPRCGGHPVLGRTLLWGTG